MDQKEIKSFEVRDNIVGFYLISAFNVKTSSNDKLYLDMTLQDKSGDINAKLWNIEKNEHETLKAGAVVKVKGTVTSWNDSPQFKITKIRVAEIDEYDIDALVMAAPIDTEEVYQEILALVQSFSNETIRIITETILERYYEKLLTHPAAKSNHHSIRGGLLYHIQRMLKVGESLSVIYDAVDKEMLYSGIILHDIEKINEMDANHLGVVSDYTSEGKLLGHLIMGIKTIDKIAEEKDLDEEISMMMQHMILSHHYEAEFGSPKKPMFLEAELLHHIDIIDARVYDFEEETGKLEPGGFSDPIWTLDRRRLYHSKYSGKQN